VQPSAYYAGGYFCSMKELLKQLAAYTIWANQQITDVILSIPEEKHTANVPGSFPSLYKTALHMWDAESIWWQRIVSAEKIVVPSAGFTGTMADVVNGMMLQSQQWLAWLNEISEESLNETFHYKSLKGDPFSQPLKEIALHISNHNTYHRGQLVNMLRQLDVSGIPQTDFVHWARKMKTI